MTNKSAWGEANMKNVSQIDVAIGRTDLDIVLKVLNSMTEHFHDPAVIDKTALMISLDELQTITHKLQNHANGDQDTVYVPMNFHDWSVYTRLILCADNSLPQVSTDDLKVMEKLSDLYSEWDDKGLAPSGP